MLKNLFHTSLLILFLGLYSIAATAQRVMVEGTPTMKDDFPKKIGNLRLSVNFIGMRKIKTNETKTDSIKIMNTWNQKMILSFQHLPAYLSMKAIPSELEPNKTGIIICTFDGSKRNDWGYFIDKVQLTTNDSLIPKKVISVTSTVEEYFPPMTSDDSATAPRIKFSEEKFDWGKIKSYDKKNHDFIITNEGKKPLALHRAKSNSSSTALHLEKTILQPGENTKLSVDYDCSEQTGNDSRTITIISSDPFRPVVTLTVACEIER